MNEKLKQTAGLFNQWLMVVVLFIATVHVQAQTAAEKAIAALSSPGPSMWKVSKEDHTLWIFGTLSPLESGVNWKSEQVESIIEQAQEYIYMKPPDFKIPKNPLKIISAIRLLQKMKNNPDGKRLEEVIPKELYERFSRLADLYRLQKIEKARPLHVAEELSLMTVKNNAFTEEHDIDVRIEELITKNTSITRTPVYLGPEYFDYELLKEITTRLESGTALEDEIKCLETTIERAESDIGGMKNRARAWAEGNVSALRKDRDHPDASGVCSQVLFDLDLSKINENWLSAAEKALKNNQTTFAVLKMDQLISPDGLLEKLRARGYIISEP